MALACRAAHVPYTRTLVSRTRKREYVPDPYLDAEGANLVPAGATKATMDLHRQGGVGSIDGDETGSDSEAVADR